MIETAAMTKAIGRPQAVSSLTLNSCYMDVARRPWFVAGGAEEHTSILPRDVTATKDRS